MAIKDLVKVSRKTFFNPRAWLGYDTVKETSQGFWGIMKGVFGLRASSFAPVKHESFSNAAARFNLTDNDLNDMQLTYFSYALLFVLMAVGILIYSVWLLLHLYISSFVIGLAVVVLLLGQAFRFHFWYFQVKHRKLGCTFAEWRSGKLHDRGADQ